MREKVIDGRVLDRVAVGLSGACLVHCVVSLLLVATLTGAGAWFTAPIIHRLGLALALLLGMVALGQGYLAHRALRPALIGAAGIALMALGLVVPHGLPEVCATVAGVSLLALGHLLNSRAHR